MKEPWGWCFHAPLFLVPDSRNSLENTGDLWLFAKRLLRDAAALAYKILRFCLVPSSGRMANRDPLGIGFEPASHSVLPPIGLRRLPLLRQGVLRFAFHCRELFSARPSRPKLEGPRVDSGMREAERCTDVTNAAVGESRWRGRAGGAHATVYGVGKGEVVRLDRADTVRTDDLVYLV
jgi:hypothetical protein